MAVPMTADQLVNALRAEGLTVVEYRSWRTHNRNSKGDWGPVNGVVLHHTASKGDSSVPLCYDGYAELPGPLCHGVITKDGRIHLVGNGRTNHAGGGDPNVLQAVIDERYTTRPPVPQQGNTSAGHVDGNAHFYGYECVNLGDGRDPWPAAQVDAMVRASAAHARFHRWTGKCAIAHREWSKDKTDPAGPGLPGMPDLREKIDERLAHAASWNPDDQQGPDMTVKPDRQMLYRLSQPVQLIPDVPYTVYWTTEGPDDGQGHGDGGKTIATNVTYSSVVSLTLDGLGAGEVVEVYPVEMNSAGTNLGSGFRAHVNGRAGTVSTSVPSLGTVSERLGFEVTNRGAQVVTLTSARLASWFWPNA